MNLKNEGPRVFKAGIVCDDYKLEYFKAELDIQGFTYTEFPGVTATTRLLRVEYTTQQERDNIQALCTKLETQKPWKQPS